MRKLCCYLNGQLCKPWLRLTKACGMECGHGIAFVDARCTSTVLCSTLYCSGTLGMPIHSHAASCHENAIPPQEGHLQYCRACAAACVHAVLCTYCTEFCILSPCPCQAPYFNQKIRHDCRKYRAYSWAWRFVIASVRRACQPARATYELLHIQPSARRQKQNKKTIPNCSPRRKKRFKGKDQKPFQI